MFSKKTKYGLLAMIALSRRYGSGPVLISELAEEENIPKKFLELILLSLKNASVLASRKGKGGGYYLAKTPEEITVGDIITILEGPLAPMPCVSVTAYEKCPECGDEGSCGIRLVMKDVRDAMADILDSTTLREVIDRSNAVVREKNQVLDFDI
ncbi:RrF2 family transcriptional regulator [Chrysiogenes arsenatis]|uniref:RrF2 family transcriptional regulator n=1 Tax=Chrysiogenes arsenatis TaxID=309797 RepID=UPI0004122ECC|nr:Rrf2 family transcriptional regulator [Chrysiogenes arsenatis]